jgi:hypothetical protein
VLFGWVGFAAPFIDKLDGYFSTAIYEFWINWRFSKLAWTSWLAAGFFEVSALT